ncbi:MAG: M50 family metallopeptidase [Armatimonadetes bacterium]|nr:M50 family metallopeptidase [Armatimonadota bacterium]
MKLHQKQLLIAIFAVLILQVLPFGGIVALPFVYLNTHLHELCHALAAVATGGTPEKIVVFADGSGVTPITGGWLTVFAPAGYVGCTLIGGAMILAARTGKGAKNVFFVTAILLTLSCLLYVRGDLVGLISGWGWCAVMWLAWQKLSGEKSTLGAQFLGALQCLNSFQAFSALIQISARGSQPTDAVLMQNATGIPALVWATIWGIFSAVVLGLTLRRAWKP